MTTTQGDLDGQHLVGRKQLIIWSDTVAVGQEIARLTGFPWYGAGVEAQEQILREDGKRSLVASIKAHGVGRNLQCFDHAFVVGGPSSGAVWEQLLGRLHRPGQRSERVCFGVFDSFVGEIMGARRDARFIQHTTGNEQKLLTAELIGFDLEDDP